MKRRLSSLSFLAVLLILSACGPGAGQAVQPLEPAAAPAPGKPLAPSMAIKGFQPGVGSADIAIGQTPEHVTILLGEPEKKVTFQEERDAWEDYGYNTREEVVFHIGFDYYLQYSPSTNNAGDPAWKIFFKDGKVNYIIFSSFIYGDTLPQPGQKSPYLFGGTEHDVAAALGEKYFKRVDDLDNINYYFFDQGVCIMIVDGLIRVVNIFAPFTAEMEAAFLGKFDSGARRDNK
ncbi:MAG: hypothetical protein ABIJ56_04720 [Pseudomonadota bacterium]